jgi:pimeloyl-[acyl-carrier protein] methyl ester esterase
MRYQIEQVSFGNPDHQAIFMLPGWAMPKECFYELAQKLSANYYVVLVNLPGISLDAGLIKQAKIGPNYDIDALTEQLISTAPKNAWWLGWSLGGMISTYVAAHRSSCVRGLITIASSPAFVQSDDWQQAMPLKDFENFERLIANDADTGMKRFVALQSKGSQDASAIRKQLTKWVGPESSIELALEGGLHLLKHLDVRRELEILDLPSLHLLGENDVLVNASWPEKIQNNCVPIEYKVLEGCAHQPFLEDLNQLYPHIENFLNAH